MLGFLFGLQGEFTKFSCFLLPWDNRADSELLRSSGLPEKIELQESKNLFHVLAPGKKLCCLHCT